MPSRLAAARKRRAGGRPARRFSVALLAALGLAPGLAAGGTTVERILAVVDGRPLLLSEVNAVVNLKGLDERAALESLIDEWLMLREARRLPQAAVTPAEEEAAFASLASRLGSPPPVPVEDLRRLARREAAILKYIEFRFRPQVRVSDEQLQAAYQSEYGAQAEPPPLESVSEGLRERLAAADLDSKVEAWVRELRTSAEIRYNAPRQ
jgi:hypothetical protein